MHWIKLYYKFLEWRWYEDIPAKVLFLHLLLKAGRTEKEWKDEKIPRGSLVTSHPSLSEGTGLTVKQIRTALAKLESTNEIVLKRASKYTIITICNYDTYQGEIEDEGSQRAVKGQTKGSQRASSKECKSEEKEIVSKDTTKKENKKVQFAPEVWLTETEYGNLVNGHKDKDGNIVGVYGNDTDGIIEYFSSYKLEKGYKTKSDYLSILRWGAEAYFDKKRKGVTTDAPTKKEKYRIL